jgi:hypothetical protein
MNPTSAVNSGILCLSSYGPYTIVGKKADTFTYECTVNTQGVENTTICNLQPLTIQLTHTFPNITKFNNKLSVSYTISGSASTFSIELELEKNYSIDGILKILNSRISGEVGFAGNDIFTFDQDEGIIKAVFTPIYTGVVINFVEENSSLWTTLGLPKGLSSFTVLDGSATISFPHSPNLRGPECIFVSIQGLGNYSCISSQKVNVIDTGVSEFTQNDDVNTHLCIPINCEYGGVIFHTMENTYSNSWIYNDFKGTLSTNYKIFLYDHKKRLLHLHPDGVCNLFFRRFYATNT